MVKRKHDIARQREAKALEERGRDAMALNTHGFLRAIMAEHDGVYDMDAVERNTSFDWDESDGSISDAGLSLFDGQFGNEIAIIAMCQWNDWMTPWGLHARCRVLTIPRLGTVRKGVTAYLERNEEAVPAVSPGAKRRRKIVLEAKTPKSLREEAVRAVTGDVHMFLQRVAEEHGEVFHAPIVPEFGTEDWLEFEREREFELDCLSWCVALGFLIKSKRDRHVFWLPGGKVPHRSTIRQEVLEHHKKVHASLYHDHRSKKRQRKLDIHSVIGELREWIRKTAKPKDRKLILEETGDMSEKEAEWYMDFIRRTK